MSSFNGIFETQSSVFLENSGSTMALGLHYTAPCHSYRLDSQRKRGSAYGQAQACKSIPLSGPPAQRQAGSPRVRGKSRGALCCQHGQETTSLRVLLGLVLRTQKPLKVTQADQGGPEDLSVIGSSNRGQFRGCAELPRAVETSQGWAEDRTSWASSWQQPHGKTPTPNGNEAALPKEVTVA